MLSLHNHRYNPNIIQVMRILLFFEFAINCNLFLRLIFKKSISIEKFKKCTLIFWMKFIVYYIRIIIILFDLYNLGIF